MVVVMKLSDYFEKEKIIRDSSFSALGLSNSNPEIPFLSYLDNEKFYNEMKSNSLISAIICKSENVDKFISVDSVGVVISDNPRKEFFTLHNSLSKLDEYFPMLKENEIGNNCKISDLASVSGLGIRIGNNVIIEDFVRIIGPCTIGDNTIIHSGSIIGGEGFEFKRYSNDILDVVHCGNVVIGSNVIIWENVTIHKAVYPWDSTTIGSWNRIGAHSHIDHGAKLSDYVEICARCTISGRSFIGDHAFVGPGAIVSNRVSIGRNAKALLGSVVTRNIEENQIVSGNFAIEHKKHLEIVKADSGYVFR